MNYFAEMHTSTEFQAINFINAQRSVETERCYIDGLISTGNVIPFTILYIYFIYMKFFHNYFIHIFFEYVNYVKASF